MLPGYFIFGLLIVWKLWTAVSYNCFGIPWYERKSNCRLMWCILEYVRHMSHPVQSIPGRCRRQTVSPDRSRDDNIIMATGQHYSLADCPSPSTLSYAASYRYLGQTIYVHSAFSILLQLLLLLPPLVTAVSICILVMAKLEQMNWQCQNICLHWLISPVDLFHLDRDENLNWCY